MAAEVRGGRRIKTQTVLPNAETPPMLFWVLMAAGQVVMRKTGGRPYRNQLPPNSLTSRPTKVLSTKLTCRLEAVVRSFVGC